MEKRQTSTSAALGITGVWLAVALFVMSKHEIWLDEAHHWLLARDSDSILKMFRNMRYEGHPPFWNILLFVIACFTDSPAAMQYVHLAFAAGTVFLIARYAPFPLWVKVLLPFTYFLGYEYAIIARNYAPAVFFIVLACVWSTDFRKNIFRITIALGVATCFHVYAGGVAFVLLIYFLWQLRSIASETGWKLKYVGVFSLFGILAAYFLLRVPSDHFIYGFHGGLFSLNRIGSTLLLPFTSLFHFPELSGDYWWNTNIFLQGSDMTKGIIGLLFWFIPALVFLKNRPIFWLYISGTILLSVGLLISPSPVSLRHAGFVAVLFFVCLWMSGGANFPKFSKSILGGILALQFGAYITTAYKEYTQPFSQAKNVAGFIEAEYPDLKVAAYPMYMGPPVSAYLGKTVFYGQYNKNGSFGDWSHGGFTLMEEDMITQCKSYLRGEKLDSMVLLGPSDTTYFYIRSPEAKFRAKFDGAAVMSENYNVYIITSE